MRKLKLIPILLTAILIGHSSFSQRISSGYEVRYFSKDIKANGETDFKGETSVFSTEERINFLNFYANEVSAYYGDKGLNTEVAPDDEVKELMTSIKPQPLPEVRTRIPLHDWKWLSYRPGQHESSLWEINKYKGAPNLGIINGVLSFQEEADWKWDFAAQEWRFSMSWMVRVLKENSRAEFSIQDNATGKAFAKIDIYGNKLFYYSEDTKSGNAYLKQGIWHQIKIEGNLDKIADKQHYNLYIDGQLVCDFIYSNETVLKVNGFVVKSSAGVQTDELVGIGYHRTNQVGQPYYPDTFLDENFDVKPAINGWQTTVYDDHQWENAKLPFGQGSERYKGEDLYFRKEINVKAFKRAYLNIETLDPGGEVWVNGKMVALIQDRYPVKLDISKFLMPHTKNRIALKVNHFYLNPGEGIISPHSPLDKNYTWFAGRAWLDLTDETFISDAFLFTKTIEDEKADIHTRIALEHKGKLGFNGKLKIKMGLWENTKEDLVEQVVEMPVLIGPGVKKFDIGFSLVKPQLWEPGFPNLYKVIIEVEDKNGNVIDDYVFTTGIRTLSQEGGTFRLNGKPAMLNGTQIMGFRAPLENMMAQFRCPSDEWVAKEMLMTQKMNCNMLRVHVHGWKEKAVGVNDPRYAEFADQMGIMLIMCTPAWIREGDWGQVDFKGYHKYMKQLQNHPSIVMWEVSNHPNTFRNNPAYESDLFCEKAYNAVWPYDQSRLISITSHIAHMIYGNDVGTIDRRGHSISKAIEQVKVSDPGNQMGLNNEIAGDKVTGDKMEATRAWTAPMVTRGNQDAATGYGAEWSQLRKWPGAYRQDFLNSKDRAYFNFEHQESIGQPNWDLCKGKPWYNLQSYEWRYDEGSIGRKLQIEEWRESQAWQAFSAYEATKKMRMLDYDGFSWCTLHGGGNAATYKKPAIDFLGHGKLVFHVHKTMFQPILAGSNNVDVAYGPDDNITPMILNLGKEREVKLTIVVRDKYEGKVIDKKVYKNVTLKEGRTVNEVEAFKPVIKTEGLYFIEYLVDEQ